MMYGIQRRRNPFGDSEIQASSNLVCETYSGHDAPSEGAARTSSREDDRTGRVLFPVTGAAGEAVVEGPHPGHSSHSDSKPSKKTNLSTLSPFGTMHHAHARVNTHMSLLSCVCRAHLRIVKGC